MNNLLYGTGQSFDEYYDNGKQAVREQEKG